jgi:hypothetical protein
MLLRQRLAPSFGADETFPYGRILLSIAGLRSKSVGTVAICVTRNG